MIPTFYGARAIDFSASRTRWTRPIQPELRSVERPWGQQASESGQVTVLCLTSLQLRHPQRVALTQPGLAVVCPLVQKFDLGDHCCTNLLNFFFAHFTVSKMARMLKNILCETLMLCSKSAEIRHNVHILSTVLESTE